MTKTLDELHKAWVDACDAYDRAAEANWESWRGRDYFVTVMADARHAMDVAWANYYSAFKAHPDAMDEAARLKPATDDKEPTP